MFGIMPWRRERKGSTIPAVQSEREMSPFRTSIEEWFDRLFTGLPVLFEDGRGGYGLEIEEKDEAVVLRADAPGFEASDFAIDVRGDRLTITAERKEMAEGKTPTIERKMRREVTLPAEVDPSKVEAKYHSGVLEIRLPKVESAKMTRIEVKAA